MFSVSVSLSNHSTHTKHKTQNTKHKFMPRKKKEKKTNAIIKSTYIQDNYLNVTRTSPPPPPTSFFCLSLSTLPMLYIYISYHYYYHHHTHSHSHSFSVVDEFINWFCPEKNTPRNNNIMESSSPSQLMKNKKNKNNLIN